MDTDDYVNAQTCLMGRFAVQSLKTGPEQHTLQGEEWKHLDRVAHNGMHEQDAWKQIIKHPTVGYLMQQWFHRYGRVFGPLAREAGVPLEVVQSHVAHHQHAVVEHLAQLRHLWCESTGQILQFPSAWEQIRWDGPQVKDIEDGQREAYFHVAALFPHVVRRDNRSVDLHFGTNSVASQIMQVPIASDVRAAVERDIAKY
jgi:hypothetical protein